jgi:hypothetical protein
LSREYSQAGAFDFYQRFAGGESSFSFLMPSHGAAAMASCLATRSDSNTSKLLNLELVSSSELNLPAGAVRRKMQDRGRRVDRAAKSL